MSRMKEKNAAVLNPGRVVSKEVFECDRGGNASEMDSALSGVMPACQQYVGFLSIAGRLAHACKCFGGSLLGGASPSPGACRGCGARGSAVVGDLRSALERVNPHSTSGAARPERTHSQHRQFPVRDGRSMG